MRDHQSLTQEQSLSLRLTPQQLRYTRLLEMTSAELDEAVERELEANPALEAREAPRPAEGEGRAGSLSFRRGREEEGTPFVIPDAAPSLYDILDEQLDSMTLPETVGKAARYIVASLDTNGYLRRDLPLLVNDMAINHGLDVTEEEARQALEAVQGLEPHGVGARSLQETLLLQLMAMPRTQTRDDAVRIVEEQFEAFTKRHYPRIASQLGYSAERVEQAIALITGLNPKPGAAVGGGAHDTARAIVPDIILERDQDGELSMALNNSFPELAIQQSFARAAADMEAHARERKARPGRDGEREFVMTNYNDARDFIRILSQRQKTLMQVMTAIMTLQKDYFATEDVYALRPMMLKDIASLTSLDMSVISRATMGKYVATPWGTFPLKFFFSDSKGVSRPQASGGEPTDSGGSGVADVEEGGENIITNRKIEARITQLVEAEDKRRPLSDEKIHRALAESGFDISRRTVAKYRDRLGIPVARLRRTLT